MPIHESMTIVQSPPLDSFGWHVFGLPVCPVTGMRCSTFNQHSTMIEAKTIFQYLLDLLIGRWISSFHDLSCRFAIFFHSLPSRILPPNNLRSCRKCAEYHALLPKEQQRRPGVYRIGVQRGTSGARREVEGDICEIRLLIGVLFSYFPLGVEKVIW